MSRCSSKEVNIYYRVQKRSSNSSTVSLNLFVSHVLDIHCDTSAREIWRWTGEFCLNNHTVYNCLNNTLKNVKARVFMKEVNNKVRLNINNGYSRELLLPYLNEKESAGTIASKTWWILRILITDMCYKTKHK